MTSICVLLHGEIRNDTRVIKLIQTLSEYCFVDLYYISDNPEHSASIFNARVGLFPVLSKSGIKAQFVRHTFFYNEFLFFVKVVLNSGKKYNYIWANDLPCLRPGIILKKKQQCKLIYDAHEIYNETINQFFPFDSDGFKKITFRFSTGIMRILGVRAEKKMTKHVDYFFTVGAGLKQYFEEKYALKNIYLLMNCPVTEKSTEHVNYVQMFNLPENAFVVLYLGVMNEGRGLKLLIQSFQYVNDGIYLVMIGDGVLRQQLEEEAEKFGVKEKVFFPGEVSYQNLMSFVSGAHIGVNLLEQINLSKSLAAPNKLFQYIHAQLPVIASFSYENNLVFNKYNIGKQVNNSVDEISHAINLLSESNLEEYKIECEKASKEYNWENQQKIIKKLIQ